MRKRPPLTGRRWAGLPLQLFFLTILPLTLLLLGISLGSLTLHRQAMRNLVGERDTRAVRTASAAINDQLNQRLEAVQRLGHLSSTAVNPRRFQAEASPFLPKFDRGLALFDTDGNLLATVGEAAFWQEATTIASLAPLFQPSGRPTQADFFFPAAGIQGDEQLVLAVSSPTIDLLVVGAFSPDRMAAAVLDGVLNPEESAFAYIVDQDGRLLYQSQTTLTVNPHLAQHPDISGVFAGQSGTAYLETEAGEHVIAFSPIAPVNWALLLEEPWESVADPLLEATEYTPFILVPALVITLVALWFGVRQIVQPLQQLADQASRLAWGDFTALDEPVEGIVEVRRLQGELVHMSRKLQSAQQNLRGYLGAVTAGQEEERRRLARDLHDDTIQSLIALNQRVQMAQMAPDGQAVTGQLAEVEQMTTQIIDDLRRLSRNLRPIYLEDLGLIAALRMLAKELNETTKAPIYFEAVGAERRLAPQTELALYRIVQEALSNAARHAQAKEIKVRLNFQVETITLTIQDDGQGFIVPESPADLVPAGHFGLLGMQERAELIGARMTIHSAPGQGTSLSILLASGTPR